MYSTSPVYVKVEGGIVSGRGLKSLCERLTQRGYNNPGTIYEVLEFYSEEYVTTLKCNPEGNWLKLVPEHWQLAYKPKGNPKPKYAK